MAVSNFMMHLVVGVFSILTARSRLSNVQQGLQAISQDFGRHSAYKTLLGPARHAGDQLDLRTVYAEGIRDHQHERRIGPPLVRRRGDSDLERPALLPDEHVAPRPRLGTDVDDAPLGMVGDLNCHESSSLGKLLA